MLNKYLLAVLAALVSTVFGAPHCEDGWLTYKDELCIKLLPSLYSYYDAKEFCSSFSEGSVKASLLQIKELDIQKTLGNFTQHVFDNVWIGGHYDIDTSQFKWEDGEPLTYTNWRDGYPRNATDGDECIELRPIESKLTIDVEHKWAHTNCRKRNLFLCQKTLAWSLQDAINEIVRVRKQVDDKAAQLDSVQADLAVTKKDLEATQINLTIAQQELEQKGHEISRLQVQLTDVSSKVVPVGFVYIEYSGQPSPRVLWPTLTWQDITESYSGLFFRALGGSSGEWGTVQDECAPRVTSVQHKAEKCTTTFPNLITVPASEWSPQMHLATNILGSAQCYEETLRFYTTNCEVRSKNQAIRIWKRI